MRYKLNLITALALTAATALPGAAQTMRLGEKNPLVPPFCEDFDNYRPEMEHDDFARYFQTIDANNDGRVWGFYNYTDGGRLSKCAYLHSPISQKMDDWLVTRAVRLKGGQHYCVSMDASLYTEGMHTFEVRYGMFNDPEGMDMPVIPETTVTSLERTHVDGWICPDMDGLYYIGVHGTTPLSGSSYLFMDNIAVSEAVSGATPGAPTDVKAVNDPDGSGSVFLSFTAPSIDMDGNALTAPISIAVKRGTTTLHTFTDVNPGQQLTYTDASSVTGLVTYTVAPSNASGTGRSVVINHYKGLANPMAPVITAFEELPGNMARLSWTAPTTDIYGSTFNPEILTYVISEVTEEQGLVEIDVIDGSYTDYTYEIEDVDQNQRLAQLALTARIDDLESPTVGSNYLAVGKPYSLPHHNSFTLKDYDDFIMEVSGDGSDVTWRMLDDFSDPHAQDGDNGYACMIGSQPGQEGELRSGKIDMTAASSPALSFYTYAYSEDENQIEIWVYDVEAGTSELAALINLSQCTRTGWTPFFVPLARWGGKVVRIGIRGRIVTHGYLPIDNVLVHQRPDVDLQVTSVAAPTAAKALEPFHIFANVVNHGLQTVTNATAVLLRDGDEVATAPVPAIEPGQTLAVDITDTFSVLTSDMPRMQVRIDAEGDGNPADNLSDPFVVAFVGPTLPSVSDLAGTFGPSDATLTWSEPNLSLVAPDEVTEDFEGYLCLQNQFPGWITEDVDGGLAAGFQGVEMPGIVGSPQSFWVMDAVDYPFIQPHSGTKMLVAMYALNERNGAVKSDDWLISPELYGGRQSISFWASSYNDNYGYEQFRVLYSTGGTDPEDFIPLTDTDMEAPVIWTQFHFTLPEGARRFAIHYTSDNVFMLQLDDITYIPAGEAEPLKLIGYNVYRNSEKLTSEPITVTTYQAPRLADSDRFCVTAVYDRGESVRSNVVSLNSALTEITAPGTDGPARYFDLRGCLIAEPTAPGIYLRRTGTTTRKLIIH